MKRIGDILLRSDVTLAAFLLGWGLMAWGMIALAMSPKDLVVFTHVIQSTTWLFWLGNYMGVGAAFVYLAYSKFPPIPSLLTGAYAIIMWSWIAAIRDSVASYTAGTVLNFIVIIMGCILLQRSQVK